MDQLTPDSIVPRPQLLTISSGFYRLTDPVRIACDPLLGAAGEWLAGHLRAGCGWRTQIVPAHGAAGGGSPAEAAITLFEDRAIRVEGYRLSVSARGVRILASTSSGALFALQSLRQLLPASIERSLRPVVRPEPLERRDGAPHPPIDLSFVEIDDWPRFPWRGAHLDVARHFFSAEEVKRLIELLALFKMNRFHWHLTDDQGWRIEIRSRPRLTAVGAKRIETDGSVTEGYYTQEQVREVVRWAAERGVTVVPEIEMPGHSQAAVASYPDLGCQGGAAAGEPGSEEAVSVWNRWGVSSHPLCPGGEETYRFLEEVIDEIAGLFPGREVHVGGDECPTDRWRRCPACQKRMREEGISTEAGLHGYLIARVQRHLAKRGKRLVGWDEILEGALAEEVMVMSWRGMAPGMAAVRRGHEVVMTPEEFCYLDHRQSDNPGEPGPRHFAPPAVTLEHLYAFEPVPDGLRPEERPRVVGVQGNLWSEAIDSPARLDYMAFPRLIALAEIAWSEPRRRDFPSFKARLRLQQSRLDRLGVGSCRILESL